jgi:hypothetical protein
MSQVQRSRRGSGSWAVVSVPGSVRPVLRAGVIGFRAHISRRSARCFFPIRKCNGKLRGGGTRMKWKRATLRSTHPLLVVGDALFVDKCTSC